MIFSISLLGIVGCGGDGDSGSGVSTQKTLFSLWDYEGFKLDLRGGKLNEPLNFLFAFTTGTCACNILAAGSDTMGTYDIYSCSLYSGSALNCSELNDSGTYTLSGNNLIACSVDGNCNTYK